MEQHKKKKMILKKEKRKGAKTTPAVSSGLDRYMYMPGLCLQ